MADWFKFYENDLDETRLQYAISKLPEVVSVWVGILSECCRHKSGTVSWRKDEIELFGFSRRLGVSVAKVNEGINLLAEIRYITKSDDKITVVKWDEKQSEYCQKRTKKQNQSGDRNPVHKSNVRIVSGHTPDSVGQEERRGEEIRREESARPRFKRPTIPEMELHASKIGLPLTEVVKFASYHDSRGWMVGRSKMASWQSAMVTWREKLKEFQAEKLAKQSSNGNF